MARKTKEDSQKTRDAILDGAERVFLAKGIANATMAEIADAAQVSRGAVYGHYDNKLQVCQAMIDRAFALDALRFPAPCASACDTLLAAGTYYLAQFLEPGSPQRVYQILYLKCEQTEENRSVLRRREMADRLTMHYTRRQLRRAIAQ
ncbi:TetR family transcriptional regulator, partial [Chromobacterium piscinae]